MKGMLKKSLALILALTMVFGAAPLAGLVGLELPEINLFSRKAEAATSGTCGENLTYSYNQSTDTLTITGYGDMYDEYGFSYINEGAGPRNVVLPNGLTSIADGAFSGCIKLTNITIPNTVKRIGKYAFNNTALLRVYIPSSVESVGDYAFSYCFYLEELILSEGLKEIGNFAFASLDFKYLTIPESVTSIGMLAFHDCDFIESVVIPENVQNIGQGAFSCCNKLKNIYYNAINCNVSGSIKEIEHLSYCCRNENGIKTNEVVHEESPGVFVHGYGTFRYLADNIYISSDVKYIPDGMFYSGFLPYENIYYEGSKEEWKTIKIGSNNDCLTSTTIHFTFEDEETLDPNEKIKLISSNPTNGETHFSLEKDIVLTFTNKIQGVSVDTICIRDYETDKVVCTAGINCIEKNGNTLTLKHMVHTPIVDGNGKTVEGGKLKGNMKYYLDIPSYAISFSDGYFEGTKSKDDLAFSTYISKDRSLEKYGFKQEYTEGDVEAEKKSNERHEGNYLNSKGKALNNLCVPGLKEGMVPQGLTCYREKGWYLISSYHNSDLPDKEKNNSVIYALNKNGEFVAQFNIHNEYGEKSLIHAGGVAVGNHNLYLTFGGRKIAYLPLSELNVPAGTVKDICIRDSVWLGKLDEGTKTSYLNISGDILWTGNFYCPALESAKIPASKGKANSIMLGYRLSGTDSLSEWNSFLKTVKQSDGNKGATYTIYLPDEYDGVQGATVHVDETTNKGTIFLSRAKYRPFVKTAANAIVSHEISLKSSEIVLSDKNWAVIKNLPGGENIFIEGEKMYCVYEASALAEIGLGGAILWNTQVETDVIWEIDVKDMLKNTKQGTVNCPVDVEIYDEDTGELVGRIKDNVVDYEIVDKENGVLMDVDGDTKYYWLDAGKNYKVVLIGNDIGTMDYSISIFDENAQLKERVNFFDIELTDGTAYTNEVEEGASLSQFVLETEDGTKIKPDQYFNNMQNAKAEIFVSAGEGGTVTESFSAVCGDKVTVEASEKDGYLFFAWTENGKIVSTDAKYSFVVKSNRMLRAEFITFSLRTPSTKTIKYGDSIILHTDLSKALPACWRIEWTASNGNFDIEVSANGSTCTITPKSSGETTFTATVYDAEGNAVLTDEQTMTSKAGFFDKIGAFFKKIFGLTKTFPEAFKGIL
ncbi:MAG: leucine-rich repeat protein [Acutalibacteraceae bacterium]